MNSQSIATYIADLEKENTDLKKRLQQCEEEKALLEYETMLQYAEVSDDESIASNDSDDDEDFFVSYNVELTDAFDKLAQEEENEFKQAVYERAANTIYRLDFKVKYGEQLAHLPGIGKGIIKKVNEFLETGEIKKKNQTFDTNENIADQLETLADLEEDYHKSSAYQNAAEAIRKLKFEVTNGTELWKGPNKVAGIGRGIANKIDEYIVTGEIRKISKHISQ